MPNPNIDELQRELDELGNETTALDHENFEDNTSISEDGLFEDNSLDVKLNNEAEEPVKVQPNKEEPKETIAEQKFKERQAKRNNRIQSLESEIGGLKSSINEIVSLLKSGKAEDAKDEFDEYAEKHNLDAAGIKELASIITSKVSTNQPKEEPVSEINEDFSDDSFDTEWNEFLPEIEQNFPKATFSQIKQVQELLDEIAHSSPQLAQYDLADIFHSPKYNQQFKDILFTGKKMFESGRTVTKGDIEKPNLMDMEINSAADAMKAQEEFSRIADSFEASPIHRSR